MTHPPPVASAAAATPAPASLPSPLHRPATSKPTPSPTPSTVKRPRPRPRSSSAAPIPRPVSREVFLLTGGTTPPSLAPVLPAHPPPPRRPTRRWQWAPFRNPARTDHLQLSHWRPAAAPPADYAFARFNKKVRILNYSDDEWNTVVKHLLPVNIPKPAPHPTDPPDPDRPAALASASDVPVPPASEPAPPKPAPSPPVTPRLSGSGKREVTHVPPQKPWTRAETDTLFELCQTFDLRFPVIHDRWPSHLAPRSIDELKDRYYSIAKAVVEHRAQSNSKQKMPLALAKHCHSINMNPFDYEYECIRKNQLEVQYRRSKAELREEEETVREARRIEASRKRLAKERQRLAKLLTPAGDIAMVGDGRKGVNPALAMAAAAASLPHKTFPHRKVVSGAMARSSMIYTPVTQSARLSRRIDEALVELGVGTRPTPTTIVVDNFDLLRMDILSYIELQRTVLRKEEDVHMLRVKLAKLKGQPPPPPPPGVTLSHKKRRADDMETGSLFGGTPMKLQKTTR